MSSPTAAADLRPGVTRPMHPVVLGSLIGAAGATTFVLVNRSGLPGPWPTAALVAWVVALAVFVWAALLRPRDLGSVAAPHRLAGLVYVAAVAGMLAVMSLGRLLLDQVGRAELQPAVVVLAVGLHFVPFAWAFRAPVFARLGWSLTAVGVLGLVLGLLVGSVAAAAAAVVTGLVMLALMTADALRR